MMMTRLFVIDNLSNGSVLVNFAFWVGDVGGVGPILSRVLARLRSYVNQRTGKKNER